MAATMRLLNHFRASQQVIPPTNTTTQPKILVTIERVQRHHHPLGCVANLAKCDSKFCLKA